MYILPIIGIIGEDFKYTDLLMHLNAASNETDIQLSINSPGGYIDEGLKIRDALLKSGKIIHANNIGDVCSIAVSIFLSAAKGLRSFDPAKGQFLIHNPLLDPKDIDMQLRADDLTAMAKELNKIESELIKQYVQATGSTAEILSAFMAEEKPLTSEQIEQLGFAKVEHIQVKAVALINLNNMNDVKELKESMSKLEKAFEAIKNLFKPKNMVKMDVNNNEVDFGEAVQAEEQIVPGVTATVGGVPCEGDYTMQDGSIYKFEKGVLMEIVKPEVEDLKKENEGLKTEVANLKDSEAKAKDELTQYKAKAEADLKKIQDEFTAFKGQFVKMKNMVDSQEDDNPKVRKAFKQK